MKQVYPVPSTFTVPLSPCGEVLLGEDCGHGAGCPPPLVTPPEGRPAPGLPAADGAESPFFAAMRTAAIDAPIRRVESTS